MGRKPVYTYDMVVAFVKAKRGTVKSKKYHHDGMKIKCHVSSHPAWVVRPSDLMRIPDVPSNPVNSWCKLCNDESKRIGIDYARAIGLTFDLSLLSTTYVNCKDLLEWQCNSCNFHFKRALNDIKKVNKKAGSKCPRCTPPGKEKFNLDMLNSIASVHGITCCSTEYVNSQTHLLWKCSKRGHLFRRTADQFMRTKRCSICHIIDKLLITDPNLTEKSAEDAALRIVHLHLVKE